MSAAGHAIEAVKTLANELSAPADTGHKGDWARGYAEGREAAGRELIKVLREQGFYQ